MKSPSKPTRLVLRLWVFSCLLLATSCQQQLPTLVSPPRPSPIKSPATSYLGLTPSAASAKATRAGLRSRTIKVDGQAKPITKDYRPTRLNFTVNQGKVTRVTKG